MSEFNFLANDLLESYIFAYGKLDLFGNENVRKLNKDEINIKNNLKEERDHENDSLELCTTFNVDSENSITKDDMVCSYYNIDYGYVLEFMYKVFVNMSYEECIHNNILEDMLDERQNVYDHYRNNFYLRNLGFDGKDFREEVEFEIWDHKKLVNTDCIFDLDLKDKIYKLEGRTFVLSNVKTYRYREDRDEFFDNFENNRKKVKNDEIKKIIYDTGCFCNRCYAMDRIYRTIEYIDYLKDTREFIDW